MKELRSFKDFSSTFLTVITEMSRSDILSRFSPAYASHDAKQPHLTGNILRAVLSAFLLMLTPFQPIIERILFALLSIGPIPQHIGIIMDGNRRYARNYPGGPIPVSQGHLSGFNALKSVLEACLKLHGMTTVTVYAFAINNFGRDKDEVTAIMDLAKRNLVQLASHGELLARHSVRLRMIGRKELLSEDVLAALEKVERMTESNKQATLNICIAYASSDEMANAVEKCIQSSPSLGKEITVQDLDDQMMLHHSPPCDILVRTSDVHRLSDFMLWQCTHAQLQFTKRYWPLFGLRELVPIVLDYQRMVMRQWLEQFTQKSVKST